MDIGTVLNAMKDQAGLPADPILFQVLMVFTWIFHIAFVHLTLGSAGLAIFSFYKKDTSGYWERLSMAMTKVAKVGVSLLIVLGVAPLLFTQVIYDPQWYASNVLSGAWAIGFIFTLMIGYCCWFAFYYANHEGAKRYIGIYAWVALALFCLDGLIMHGLSYQAILVNQWMEWYAPNGIVNTSGTALHAIEWTRYLFIMSLSIPAVGLFLLAYTQYFSSRADREEQYRDFVWQIGARLSRTGLTLSLILMLFWQLGQPQDLQLLWHPIGWGLVLSIGLMLLWSFKFKKSSHGYIPLLGGLIVLGLLAVWREVIRVQHLAQFDYHISNYTLHVDWPSTVLFFLTLIGVGGLVGGFYLTVLYKAGRTQGVYHADQYVSRLGVGAIAILAVWIAVFFAYGIVIWLRNSFL